MAVKPTNRKPDKGRGAITETRTIASFKSKRDNIVAGRPTVRQRAERNPAPTNNTTPVSPKKPVNRNPR